MQEELRYGVNNARVRALIRRGGWLLAPMGQTAPKPTHGAWMRANPNQNKNKQNHDADASKDATQCTQLPIHLPKF